MNKTIEEEFWSPAYANIFANPSSAEAMAMCGNALTYFGSLDPEQVTDKQIDLMVHLGLAQEVERTEEPSELERLIGEATKADQDKENDNWEAKIAAHLDAHPESVNEAWPGFSVTPLHECACAGLESLTRLLLSRGADRTMRNTFNETAAERCRVMGHEDLAKLIDEWPQ
jgi:hypothetical protein